MNQQAVADAVYAALSADQSSGSLWSSLGGRIHHLQAPPDEALPLLVFRIAADRRKAYFNANDDGEYEIEIKLWGTLDTGANSLAAVNDQLIDLLQHQSLSVPDSLEAKCEAKELGDTDVQHDTIRITSRWQLQLISN